MQRALRTAAGEQGIDFVDGTGLATALMGDAIAANLFMLGYALQKGLVPLSRAAIERAIELNGVGVEMQQARLRLGPARRPRSRPVEAPAKPALRDEAPKPAESFAEIVGPPRRLPHRSTRTRPMPGAIGDLVRAVETAEKTRAQAAAAASPRRSPDRSSS